MENSLEQIKGQIDLFEDDIDEREELNYWDYDKELWHN